MSAAGNKLCLNKSVNIILRWSLSYPDTVSETGIVISFCIFSFSWFCLIHATVDGRSMYWPWHPCDSFGRAEVLLRAIKGNYHKIFGKLNRDLLPLSPYMADSRTRYTLPRHVAGNEIPRWVTNTDVWVIPAGTLRSTSQHWPGIQ